MAISRRLGSSFAMPSRELHLGWIRPRTFMVMWQWSITHPEVSGSSHTAQRPFCSRSIVSYLSLVRPNFRRRNSKRRSMLRGERRTATISLSVSPAAALGLRPAPGLFPPLGMAAYYSEEALGRDALWKSNCPAMDLTPCVWSDHCEGLWLLWCRASPARTDAGS
jgi:hypothetical protein